MMVGKTLLQLQQVSQYLIEHPEVHDVHTNDEIVAKVLEKDFPNVRVHYYKNNPKDKPLTMHHHFGNDHLFWMDELTEKKQ